MKEEKTLKKILVEEGAVKEILTKEEKTMKI